MAGWAHTFNQPTFRYNFRGHIKSRTRNYLGNTKVFFVLLRYTEIQFYSKVFVFQSYFFSLIVVVPDNFEASFFQFITFFTNTRFTIRQILVRNNVRGSRSNQFSILHCFPVEYKFFTKSPHRSFQLSKKSQSLKLVQNSRNLFILERTHRCILGVLKHTIAQDRLRESMKLGIQNFEHIHLRLSIWISIFVV